MTRNIKQWMLENPEEARKMLDDVEKTVERIKRDGVTPFEKIRRMSGLSKTEFAKKYYLPYRSVQNWEAPEDSPSHRDCPGYLLKLLERVVREDFDINNSK